LLIVGSPGQVPWRLQQILAATRCVGRLDLDATGLERYVNALLNEFAHGQQSPARSVVWATNHDPGGISGSMRDRIAARVFADLREDRRLGEGARFLDGDSKLSPATNDHLIETLGRVQPSLVVSTSHGAVTEANPPGRLVDQRLTALDPVQLVAGWAPSGAIWYARACASAGCDTPSPFEGVFPAGNDNARLLESLASRPPQVAELPKLLLGAPAPLRAFVGHVEPTFDLPLRPPAGQAPLLDPLLRGLHPGLQRGEPIGLVLREHHAQLQQLYAEHAAALGEYDSGQDNLERLLYLQLAARDVQSTVLLGDPAVTLPSVL
jgi:hypothetical protein